MLLYSFLKFLLQVSTRLFFRRFEVDGIEKLHALKPPLIVVVNHPNTFMDPLIIATLIKQRVAFIGNGSIFNRYTRPIFKYFHVVPVYRKKDTSDVPIPPVELNRMTFQRCYDYLEANGTLLIFPEGTSEIERRLREIKTGAARIALGAEHENNFELGVTILPMGLNYSDPTHFRSEVFVNIGNPIFLADFKTAYHPDSFEAVEKLTDLIQERLVETVIITQDEREDNLVMQVEKLYKNQLFDDLNLDYKNKKHEFELIKRLVRAVRYFEQYHPEQLRTMRVKITNYLDNLKKLHLSDAIFTESRRLYRHLGVTLLALIMGLPFYLFGLITNYLPYVMPARIARWISTDITYRAPIMMTAGLVIFPLYYGLEIWLAYNYLHNSWLTLTFAIAMPFCGYFVLWYWDVATRLRHVGQALRLFRQKPTLMQSLSEERKEIFKAFEAAKDILKE